MDQLSPLEQNNASPKEVAKHARPHIETHVRSKGHSAVAGAAYRLGLKLFDERTGTWHDYSRRSTSGEIVLALTLAPEGSPPWATRPQELWSRAEQSEKRKDSQVARDFRVPLALGMSPDQACALAQQMGQFISDTLKTPVSIGVHRDSTIDVLGEKKASEKVGYHAHLYFPTRCLACFDALGEGGDGNRGLAHDDCGTGFGSKLTVLSNKRTSSVFVELLNSKWAELSNTLCEDVGLPATYDHRSYVRQGLDVAPQPSVGQAATALERRGVATRKGNQLREALKSQATSIEGVMPSPVASPLVVSTEPREEATQALADVAPAKKPLEETGPVLDAPTSLVPTIPIETFLEPDFTALTSGNVAFFNRLRQFRQPRAPLADIAEGMTKDTVPIGVVPTNRKPAPLITIPLERAQRREGGRNNIQGVHSIRSESKPSLEVLARRHRLVVMKSDSIAMKLQKVLPPPFNASDRELLRQGLVLVQMLEKLLATLEAAEEDKDKKAQAYEQARAAALEADYRVDQARQSRRSAESRLNLWEKNRPKSMKLLDGMMPVDKRKAKLQEDVRWKDDLVQAAKRASKALHAFSQEALRALMRIQALLIELRRDLAVTAVDLRSRNLRMFEEFCRWISMRERQFLDEALPGKTDSEFDVEGEVSAGADTGAAGSGTQKGAPLTSKPVPKVLPELRRWKR